MARWERPRSGSLRDTAALSPSHRLPGLCLRPQLSLSPPFPSARPLPVGFENGPVALWNCYSYGASYYDDHSITAPIKNPTPEPETPPSACDFEWGHITRGKMATTEAWPVTQTHCGSKAQPQRDVPAGQLLPKPIRPGSTQISHSLGGVHTCRPSQHQEGPGDAVHWQAASTLPPPPGIPGGRGWRPRDPLQPRVWALPPTICRLDLLATLPVP